MSTLIESSGRSHKMFRTVKSRFSGSRKNTWKRLIDLALYLVSCALGGTGLLLAYKRHPAVARHLAGAHLGGADEDARDWLLADQAELLLYLAEGEEARRFLAAQWQCHEGPPLEVTEEELRGLVDAWREAT